METQINTTLHTKTGPLDSQEYSPEQIKHLASLSVKNYIDATRGLEDKKFSYLNSKVAEFKAVRDKTSEQQQSDIQIVPDNVIKLAEPKRAAPELEQEVQKESKPKDDGVEDDDGPKLCPGFTANQTLANCRDLNCTEKLMISIMNGLSTRGWCWAGNGRYAFWLGKEEGTIKNIMSDLSKRHYIFSIGIYRGHQKRVVHPYFANKPKKKMELLDKCNIDWRSFFRNKESRFCDE